MSARASEKLIILQNVCNGLLVKAYTLQKFTQPSLFDVKIDKVVKHLVKNFEHGTEGVERVGGYDTFKSRAADLIPELVEYYNIIADIAKFQQSCMASFLDISENIVDFKLHSNPDLYTRFMDLTVSYAKLNILIGRFEAATMVVSVYCHAHLISVGSPEEDADLAITYLQEFASPIDKMRKDSGKLGLRLGETLMNIRFTYLTWLNIESHRQSKLFDVLDSPDFSQPMSSDKSAKYQELQYHGKMRDWILFGYLVCPSELAREEALPLLQAALGDGFQVRIFRDVTMDMHGEYAQMFESFQHHSIRLNKNKKVLRDAELHSVKGAGLFHRQLRNLLRRTLKNLLQVFNEVPGLIPPKIQMVYSVLSLTRSEILWLFSHWGESPKVTKKGYKEEYFQDENVGTLIHYSQEMMRLVQTYIPLVKRYYDEVITEIDAAALGPLLDALKQERKVDSGVLQLIGEILGIMQSGELQTKSLEALRMNWYRASASLSSAAARGSGNPSDTLAMTIECVNEIVVHSRSIDRIEPELRKNAFLSDIWWFRTKYQKMFEKTLTKPIIAGYCLSFIRVIHSALENVHRAEASEQQRIGKGAVKLAQTLLMKTCEQVQGLLTFIRRGQRSLEDMYLAHPELYNVAAEDSKPSLKNIALAARKKQAEIQLYKEVLSEICSAFRSTPFVVVYNTRLYPSAFLYDQLQKSFQHTIRSLAIDKHGVSRPTEFMRNAKLAIRAYLTVDRHINIHVPDMIRQVLYDQFHENGLNNPGEVITLSTVTKQRILKDKKRKHRIAVVYGKWFTDLIDGKLAEKHICYSRVVQGFVKHGPGHSGVPADQFTDIIELRAFCEVAGPAGVRVVDQHILQRIRERVSNIRVCLKTNEKVLSSLGSRISDVNFWWKHTHNKITGLDNLVVAAISVGCMLRFRETLYKALHQVTDAKVPILIETVKAIRDPFPAFGTPESLDQLTQEVGMKSDYDRALRIALGDLNKGAGDHKFWRFLPDLMGLSFVAHYWRNINYVANHEALSNNGHLFGDTLIALAKNVLTVNVSGKDDFADEAAASKIAFKTAERFLHTSSYTLLHMSSTDQPFRSSFSHHNVSAMMLFLESFIRSSDNLSMSMLETCLPFTILRNSYTLAIERATSGALYASKDQDEADS